jgi:hypothetical protein
MANAPQRVVGRPFTKGVSANPGGRPKGLASRIREETADGAVMVAFVLDVFRDDTESTKMRLEDLHARGFSDEAMNAEAEFSASRAVNLAASALVWAGVGPLYGGLVRVFSWRSSVPPVRTPTGDADPDSLPTSCWHAAAVRVHRTARRCLARMRCARPPSAAGSSSSRSA